MIAGLGAQVQAVESAAHRRFVDMKCSPGSGADRTWQLARPTRRRLDSREPATRALTSSLCEIQIVFVNDNTYTTHAPTGATAGTTEITPSVGWPHVESPQVTWLCYSENF